MTTEEKQDQMLQAMDRLWGAINESHSILLDLIDHKDSRLSAMGQALDEAQDILMPLLEK